MGTYIVILMVTDQSGNNGTDRFWVIVEDTTSPLVDLGPDMEVDQGETVVLKPDVWDNSPSFDPGNATRWTVVGPATDLDVNGLSLAYTPMTMGRYKVTCYVTDPAGNVGVDAIWLTAHDAHAPSVDPGEDRTVEMGEEVTLDGAGTSDNDLDFPEGAVFSWHVLGPQLDITLSGSMVTFEPPWIGDYRAVLTATDAAGNSANGSLVVTSVDTSPPEYTDFTPRPDQLSETDSITVTFVIIDHGTGIGDDQVAYRIWLPTTGAWTDWDLVDIGPGGNRVEVTMDLEFPEGESRYQVRCHDVAANGPVLSDEHPIRVNSRPVVVVLSPQDGAKFNEGDLVTMDATASSDPDPGDTLYYSWFSDLDGLMSTSGRVQIATLSPGAHRISVMVTDGVEGHEVGRYMNVTVLPEPETVTPEADIPWFVWMIVLIVVMATVAVVWDHVHKRQRPPPPEEVGEAADEVPAPADEGDEWLPMEEPRAGRHIRKVLSPSRSID
jgi:hypothetical protein